MSKLFVKDTEQLLAALQKHTPVVRDNTSPAMAQLMGLPVIVDEKMADGIAELRDNHGNIIQRYRI